MTLSESEGNSNETTVIYSRARPSGQYIIEKIYSEVVKCPLEKSAQAFKGKKGFPSYYPRFTQTLLCKHVPRRLAGT